MKSPLVTVLSILGVLATAGGAMAANSAALSTFVPGVIGQASEVLVPSGVTPGADAVSPSGAVSPDGTSLDATGAEPAVDSAGAGNSATSATDPAPVVPVAAKPVVKAPVSGNSGGSPVYSGDETDGVSAGDGTGSDDQDSDDQDSEDSDDDGTSESDD